MRLHAIASAFRFNGIQGLPIVRAGTGGPAIQQPIRTDPNQPLEVGERKPYEHEVESPIEMDI